MAKPEQGLIPVLSESDVLPGYRGTPVDELLRHHNLGVPVKSPGRPRALICHCSDPRINLRLPRGFAFVLSTSGARLEGLEFEVAYAVGVAGVGTLCVIGHDDCSMVGLQKRRADFVDGITRRAGWSRAEAEALFDAQAPRLTIDDSIVFVRTQAERLQARYPELLVAPLFFSVRPGRLLQVAV